MSAGSSLASLVRVLMLGALGTLCVANPALAQPVLFGSLDDPREAARLPAWDRERHIDWQAGLSLIGAQWRSAARVTARFEGPAESVELEASARAGVFGSYGPDLDEPYDLLRIVSHARLDPTARRPLYLRLGPLRRMRLGPGHLVDFLSSETAWDDRTVGVEARITRGPFAIYGFAQDVRMDRLVGGRIEFRPLAGSRSWLLSSIQGAASRVADRSTFDLPGKAPVDAWSYDVRFAAARSGAFRLEPFVSFSRFTRYGRGLLFGADVVADNFIDLASIHFRLAAHYGGRQFQPGYFGAFYPVHSQTARIVSSDASGIDVDPTVVGLPLDRATGGNDILTELRLHFFDRFELWYAFRRHYGVFPLSEYHLRLSLRATRFRLALGQDRGGLGGFFSVLKPLSDESALYFNASYRMLRRVWIHTEARYTYERVDVPGADSDRYLVQRWFEPWVGLRTAF